MRDLIRRDQERQQGIADLQRLIDAGIESGVGTRTLDEILIDARRRAKA